MALKCLEVRYVTNVIVAFSKLEDGKSIKNILIRNGFHVAAVCTSGAHAINCMDGLNTGIVISGCRFKDMVFQDLWNSLPQGFVMLLMASPARLSANVPEGMVFLPMPLKVQDLIGTLNMMTRAQMRRRRKGKPEYKERSEKERQTIAGAKSVLMERNNMSETEAHRYIQKCSMDSGTSMVETAQMVMSLANI